MRRGAAIRVAAEMWTLAVRMRWRAVVWEGRKTCVGDMVVGLGWVCVGDK